MSDSLPSQRSADVASFTELFRAVAPVVRRYAAGLVGQDLADDVVAETFAVVLRKWGAVPDAPDARRAWVFGVARLTAKVALRSERAAARRAADGHRTAPDPAELVAGEDRFDRLMAELPAKEREAAVLTVWYGLSATEAARLVGCAPATMRRRVARAHRRLRSLVAAQARVEREAGHVR